MSTIPATAAPARHKQKRLPNPARDNRFYLAMAIACAIGVFIGFSRTYFLSAYFASPALPLLFEIHGAVFTSWMIYIVVQAALIADRRVSTHRRLGYAGAALAFAMIVLGTCVAYSSSKYGLRRPIPFVHNPEGAFFFSLIDLLLFAVFVGAGFYFRRNRQVHQRLMTMATGCALMPSALGRLPTAVHPVFLVFLLVFAGPIYDLMTLRRIHPAYLWSLLVFFFTLPPIRMLAGNSALWYRVAHRLLS